MEPIVLLALHLIADFPLQTDAMAANKIGGGVEYLKHIGTHFVLYAVVLVYLYGSGAFLAAMFLAGLHGVIDWRRWTGFDAAEAVPIWTDQALHVAAIALTVVWFG